VNAGVALQDALLVPEVSIRAIEWPLSTELRVRS